MEGLTQAYLESIGPDVWLVTVGAYASSDAIASDLNKANVKDKYVLFEGIIKYVFSHINSSGIAHEIWESIRNVHEVSSDVKEEKFYILKNEYDTLTMLPHEKFNDVYAHIQVLVEKINSLGLGTIKDTNVIYKVLRVLPTNI